ncbi:hypothetical protein WJ69_01895 [Burkholderia ubonensis]|uniref:hypothetical protein n=1 Tax=Burkholderia ubonensis TaxID=101571 RepID=UPI0007581353|nr:hypothetical protein [Burkholderia ubonensis]KVN97969.1 hypothetical protein WJ69_01895 [Burkholderia ubonensis]
MKSLLNLYVASAMAFAMVPGIANANGDNELLKLSYLDGKPETVGVDNVNKVLAPIGAHISLVSIPAEATPFIEASKTRALTKNETQRVMALFALHRGQLLEEIAKAGRQPEAHRGGYLTTSDVGDAPYPKLFDMKAIPAKFIPVAQTKYGKLHVNTSDDGFGIDELMTVVSGGPWIWFFRLPDGEIVKLSVGPMRAGAKAFRISYAGLVPHGAFLNAAYGLSVAYAIGPKSFHMRYDDPSVAGADVLGTNPWIDFTGSTPRLRN